MLGCDSGGPLHGTCRRELNAQVEGRRGACTIFHVTDEVHDIVTAVLLDRGSDPNIRKRLAEEEQLELEEFQEACLVPESEGVAYAVEKMAAAQTSLKEQFKEVFLELKRSLEVIGRRWL